MDEAMNDCKDFHNRPTLLELSKTLLVCALAAVMRVAEGNIGVEELENVARIFDCRCAAVKCSIVELSGLVPTSSSPFAESLLINA